MFVVEVGGPRRIIGKIPTTQRGVVERDRLYCSDRSGIAQLLIARLNDPLRLPMSATALADKRCLEVALDPRNARDAFVATHA
jgi:hypothetical protein